MFSVLQLVNAQRNVVNPAVKGNKVCRHHGGKSTSAGLSSIEGREYEVLY